MSSSSEGLDMFGSSSSLSDGNDDEASALALQSPSKKKRRRNVMREDDQATLDDHEGYYRVRIGEEILRQGMKVTRVLGKGNFSTVVLAEQLQGEVLASVGKKLAIKITRNVDTCVMAANKENDALVKILRTDMQGRYPVIRVVASFQHKGHFCLAFPAHGKNLREVLQDHGPMRIREVQRVTLQLFKALELLFIAEVVHADIKPDNVLKSAAARAVVLADLGACRTFAEALEDTNAEMLGSRYYRAPELMLGLRYGAEIDLWALGVTLYELFTGQFMFEGVDNNDMLRLHQELMGPFSKKMVRHHMQTELYADSGHFDMDGVFCQHTTDPITNVPVIRRCENMCAKRNLRKELLDQLDEDDGPEERQLVLKFSDLLSKMLALQPEKRILISAALKHPFISSQNT